MYTNVYIYIYVYIYIHMYILAYIICMHATAPLLHVHATNMI